MKTETSNVNNPELTNLINQVREKILMLCKKNKYIYLCKKIETDSGLTWVINRCIEDMTTNTMKLSAVLAQLEAELEHMA